MAQTLGFAVAAFQANNFGEAYRLCELALKHDRDNANALHLFGVLNAIRNDFPKALKFLNRALKTNPHHPDLLVDKGKVLTEIGQTENAMLCFDKALSINERHTAALEYKASTLLLLKRPEPALGLLDSLLQIVPNHVRALNNRGLALEELGRYDEAIDSLKLAIASDPQNPEIWVNLGNVLCKSKWYNEALVAYQNAITINPDFAEGWLGRGNALGWLKNYEDAFAASEKVLAIRPDLAEAWNLRGGIYAKLRNPQEAAVAYAEAMRRDQQLPFVKGNLLHQKMLCCDWSNFENLVAEIERDIELNRPSAEPFGWQGVANSERSLQQAAQIYSAKRFPHNFSDSVSYHAPESPRKIRVGYLSAEFRVHATSHLLTGVLEEHDDTNFEVFIFDNGWDDNSDIRRRIEASAHKIVDVAPLSDALAVGAIRKAGIDILINLNGYFGDHRMGIFARRAAPIQVNYLGFPGTLGCDYIDYIIADRFVIPENRKSFYTEKVVYLPDSYQPNDNTKIIGASGFTRQELGLPEQGFVFCCFNNSYKIVPEIFDCWARILKQVDKSVLWLLKANASVVANLINEAKARGVDPARLVFADRMPLADHLARHRLADLFLDTLPYNAHTTASDALWAGLPVLTQIGTTFPGRVAASLLNAVGLSEFVVRTQQEYEKTAINLAANPNELAVIKNRLAQNRSTAPLFNTRQFTRRIEDAYRAMYIRYQQGLAPDHISISN